MANLLARLLVFVSTGLIINVCRAAEVSHSSETLQMGTEGEHGEGGVDVLAVFVIMLVIGVATYHILAITRIPYTALLIVSGFSPNIAGRRETACRHGIPYATTPAADMGRVARHSK